MRSPAAISRSFWPRVRGYNWHEFGALVHARARDFVWASGCRVRSYIKLECTPPILGSILVPLCGLVVLFILGPQIRQVPFEAQHGIPLERDLRGRGLVVVTMTALIVGMIGLVCLSVHIIRQHIGPCPARWLRMTTGIALAAFSCTLLFSYSDAFYGLTSSWYAVEALPSRFRTSMLFHVLNAAGAVPTVFVVSAAASTLRTLRTDCAALDAKRLRIAMDNLRHLLFAVAAILVIAVVELFSVYHWVYLSVMEEYRLDAFTLGLTLAGAVGAFYSIFLLAVFGPALLIQCHAGERIAEATNPLFSYAEQQVWMKQQGFRAANLDLIGKAVALFAPFMAGTLLPPLVIALFKSAL